MKRKIALLLVLAMILAMVPANLMVSANTPGTVSTPVSSPTGYQPADSGENFSITINAGLVWSQLVLGNDVRIEVALRGSGDRYLRFLPGDGVVVDFEPDDHLVTVDLPAAFPPPTTAEYALFDADEMRVWQSFRRGAPALLTDAGIALFDEVWATLHGAAPANAQAMFLNNPAVLSATNLSNVTLANAWNIIENDLATTENVTIWDGTAGVVTAIPGRMFPEPDPFAVAAPVASGEITPLVASFVNSQIAAHNDQPGWAIFYSEDESTLDDWGVSLGDITVELNLAPDMPTGQWHGPDNSLTTTVYPFNDATTVGEITAEMFVQGHQRAVIVLSAAGLSPQAVGSITIPVLFPIRTNTPNDKLYAYLGNVGSQHVLADGYLTNFGRTGIDIVAGTVVDFEWDANLNAVTIREEVLNGLVSPGGSQQLTIRLTAPQNYSWSSVAANGLLGVGPHADNRINLYSPQGVLTFANTFVHSLTATDAMVNQQGREELVITTTIQRNANSLVAGGMGSIQIRRLQLVPHESAPATGDVRIDVRVGTSGSPIQLFQNQQPRGIEYPGWTNFQNETHTRTGLLVARRVTAGLTLSVLGDDLPDFRSGYIIDTNIMHAPFIHEGYEWLPSDEAGHRPTTGRTATMRIQENVFNALDMARGRPVTFEVPDGFIITGMQWRYYRVGQTPRDPYWNLVNVNDAYGNWGQVARPLPGSPANQDVSFPNDTTVRLHVPITHHAVQGIRSHRMNLEVRLFVSVEGGSAGRGLDSLEVTVAGSGAANLPGGTDTAVVAEVHDPVTIAHVGDPAFVNFIGREQNINHVPAGAVVISETEGGMLQLGTRLWLTVQPMYGIGFPLTISRGTVLTDATTGLGLTVRDITPTTGLNQARQMVLLEVTRESQPDSPGTITFDGITLFGHVYQGDRYFLTVTGPAIAENHLPVWMSQFSANAAVPPNVGTFQTPPYFVEIVEAVDHDEMRGFANSLEGVVFNPTVAIGGVTPPIIWRRLPGMTHEAGFVAARSFAVLAGVADENINWSSGVATISGWNVQGQWVTVILTQNSTTATVVVDNVVGTVDIAEFAEGQSGPAGTVAPIFYQNRIYLPFRFLFNAFGYSTDYTLSRVGNTAVVGTR